MGINSQELEQTLVLIKPDALKNSLTGYIFSMLSEFHTGLRFSATKIVHVTRMLAEEHYAEHRGKVFFPGLVDYLTGKLHYPDEPWKRRVIALVYQGPNAIKKIREVAGPTDPHEAREKKPGCIRALGTVVPIKNEQGEIIGHRLENLIHASASPADAEREIKLWFKPNDIPPGMRLYPTEISEDHFYFLDGRLYKDHQPGAVCLLAPGDTVWASDLEALERIYQNKTAHCSVYAVAAKYLINETDEE